MNEGKPYVVEETCVDAVNQLLQPLCTISSLNEQVDVLNLIRGNILDPSSDGLAEAIRKDPKGRQALAEAILQRVAYVSHSPTRRAVQLLLRECCGVSHSLEAALRLIRDDDVDDNKSASSLGFETSLDVVAWILIRESDLLYQLLQEICTTDSSGPASVADATHTHANEVAASVRKSFLHTWTRHVILLSRVIANRCQRRGDHGRIPAWGLASTWESRLVECALVATCNHRRESALPSHYLECLLACLLSRLGGGSDNVALGSYRAWSKVNEAKEGSQPGAETSPSREVVNILQHFPPTQVARFCRSMLLLALSQRPGSSTGVFPDDESVAAASLECCFPGWLLEFCLPLLAASEIAQDGLIQETMLSEWLVAPHVASGVATLLHMIDNGAISSNAPSISDHGREINTSDDENSRSDMENEDQTPASTCHPLLRQVHRVAPLWSSSQWQARSQAVQPSQRQQQLLTVFLQMAFELLSRSRSSAADEQRAMAMDASNDTVLVLMQGISERLQSTNPRLRKDGMILGEVLGKHVLGQSIVFDELHQDDIRNESSTPPDTRSQLSGSSRIPSARLRRSTRRWRDGQTDPDALYVSDSDASEDESSNSTESRGQYSDDSEWDGVEAAHSHDEFDVEDDEHDLRVAGVPLYLQECLDLLRTPETEDVAYAKHLAALEALPELIRARPGDLPDFGPPLAKHLVSMENKFSIDNFDEMVFKPLCALVAEEPLTVAQALIDDVFHRDGSLHNRILTFAALAEASLELSESKRLQSSYFLETSTNLTPLDGPRSFGKCRLVHADHKTDVDVGSDAPEMNTRRWGRLRTGNRTVAFTNRFSGIAPVWFYSLLEKFWDRKGEASLWSGHVGSLLLARFIQTLSVLVESCGEYHSSTQVLANDLMTFIWRFRDAEVAEVRSSVLCAVGTCFTMMSEESVLQLLLDTDAIDLPHYIESTCRNDEDSECRSLAFQISSSISRNVKSLGL